MVENFGSDQGVVRNSVRERIVSSIYSNIPVYSPRNRGGATNCESTVTVAVISRVAGNRVQCDVTRRCDSVNRG